MTNPKFAVTSDAGRYYNIRGYEDTTFRSVTTALNALAKPALMPWAAKLVAERAYDVLTGKLEAPTKKADCLKFLKAAPREYTEASQKRGTAVHHACENYSPTRTEPYDPEILPYVQAYEDFLIEEGFTILEQELTVFHPVFGYAGTLDAIVERGGKHYVMDIKTGGVYPSASLQMAAYAHATHKLDGTGLASEQTIDIEGGFVLELKPNKYTIHYMDVGNKQFDTFLKVLEVSIWNTEDSRHVEGDEFA